ncbi:MAG: class I SAM-dependent methyltransferase [Patescibacteria group bacterium]
MPSEAKSEDKFVCHLCGAGSYRVVVRGNTSRQQAAGHGEVSMEEYTCTSRHHGQFFQVVECLRCRLRSLFPLPPAQAVEDAYTRVKDSEYLSIEPPRKIAFTKLLQRLKNYSKPPGKLLDVGCYTGVFPWLAEQHGYDAYGVEPSKWAADIAAERLPGRIHQGYLENAAFPSASFDLVTSWDVIEHVTDPAKEIKLMAGLLKPSGWLCLSTMASEALIVKTLGSRWPWYMPMHLFYFTPQTLSEFLRRAGLSPKRPEPYPHYTTMSYVFWKLEPALGLLARALSRSARQLGFSERVIKIDLGDFFLIAAKKQ